VGATFNHVPIVLQACMSLTPQQRAFQGQHVCVHAQGMHARAHSGHARCCDCTQPSRHTTAGTTSSNPPHTKHSAPHSPPASPAPL
jgi:hypothetical protein